MTKWRKKSSDECYREEEEETVKNGFSYLDYEQRSNEFITQEKWIRREL